MLAHVWSRVKSQPHTCSHNISGNTNSDNMCEHPLSVMHLYQMCCNPCTYDRLLCRLNKINCHRTIIQMKDTKHRSLVCNVKLACKACNACSISTQEALEIDFLQHVWCFCTHGSLCLCAGCPCSCCIRDLMTGFQVSCLRHK